MSKPKWSEKQVKDAIKALRDAVLFIKCEQPLSFKEALDYAESYIQQAREEHRRYMDACHAAGMIEASPEALFYRRHGHFPPKKKTKEEEPSPAG